MKITIGGTHGSGKSTIARAIAQRLGLKHYSAGDFMREIAAQRGMSVLDIVALAERDSSINKEVDERTRMVGRKENNFVFDGNLAFHFIQDSIKVFLKVDLDVAARRIWKDLQAKKRIGEEASSIEELKELIKVRAESERKQYKDQYKLDPFDEKNFDFVLDTTGLDIEGCVQRVADFVLHAKR